MPDEVKAATARKAVDIGAEAKNQENIPDNENGELYGQTRMQRSGKVKGSYPAFFFLSNTSLLKLLSLSSRL